MKKIKWIALMTFVALVCCNCEKTPEPINQADIFGLWLEQDLGRMGEYMRFLTAEQEPQDGDFYFGKEWDEGDDVYESDLKYKGNGWFKWKIEDHTLTIVGLMDNGGAEIPKVYTIDKLSPTTLVLYEPDDKTDKETWMKQ